MSAVVVSDRPGFLQNLDTIAVLWRRDLLRFLRQPSRIIGALGQPVLFWLLLGSGMGAAFTIPGAPGLGYPGRLDNLQAYHAIQMSLLVPLWAVSGAMFPSPGGAFGTVMRLDPLSYAVEAVRRALYGGLLPAGIVPHASLATDLLVLLAFLALSFGLAVFVVHRRR